MGSSQKAVGADSEINVERVPAAHSLPSMANAASSRSKAGFSTGSRHRWSLFFPPMSSASLSLAGSIELVELSITSLTSPSLKATARQSVLAVLETCTLESKELVVNILCIANMDRPRRQWCLAIAETLSLELI